MAVAGQLGRRLGGGPVGWPVGGWRRSLRTITAGLAKARRCCPCMSATCCALSPPARERRTWQQERAGAALRQHFGFSAEASRPAQESVVGVAPPVPSSFPPTVAPASASAILVRNRHGPVALARSPRRMPGFLDPAFHFDQAHHVPAQNEELAEGRRMPERPHALFRNPGQKRRQRQIDQRPPFPHGGGNLRLGHRPNRFSIRFRFHSGAAGTAAAAGKGDEPLLCLAHTPR